MTFVDEWGFELMTPVLVQHLNFYITLHLDLIHQGTSVYLLSYYHESGSYYQESGYGDIEVFSPLWVLA